MSTNTSATLTELVTVFVADAEKFYNGNNAAGARARKTLQEIIKFSRAACHLCSGHSVLISLSFTIVEQPHSVHSPVLL